MSAAVIHLPDPVRLRAGMEAVRARAAALNVPSGALRRALGVLLREMQSGRSTAASVALANSSMRQEQSSMSDEGSAA